MGAKMSKPELRKRGARLLPADEALEERLLEDYVHVSAPEEEAEGGVPPAAPETVAQQQHPRGLGKASLGSAAEAGLAHQLSRLWRGLVLACLSSWSYIRGALLWCLSKLGLAPPPQPRLSLVQQERLQSLQERVAVPYDADSPTHQAALRALWDSAFPGHGFPAGIKSERWKEMGWQSDDPGRDFRGAGFISLESLLYMAQREEAVFFQLMGKVEGRRSEWEYPFAAGGVNLAFMLSEVLDLRDPGKIPSTPAGRAFLALLSETDTAFEEAFVASYILLDRTWLEMGASYMDFPIVIKSVRHAVEAAMGRGVRSVEEFQQKLLSKN